MAVRVTPRLGPQLAKLARSFHHSTTKHAGSEWRLKNGLPANPSDHGLTTDLPDWSFADGRPAPLMSGQLRRQEKNRQIVRRITELSAELDHGMKKWEAKMRKQEQDEEEKRRNRLQPKGALLQQVPK
ncbi:39S ribosomal protein L52, mitochondrial [Python bivittatus]|uniref:Large ribosomal subunit protein mL52 n=1 Tax=Python bivittatus TaxID=176946 RepID=A0A9F2R4Q5_PYTBI|nr:39S ribosomal protein L52, mitochondrial [Python bivittatus]